MRILIIAPSWVGDTVMAQGLLKLLKQRDPTVSLDVLAPTWAVAVLDRMLEVNQAIECPLKHGELKLAERYRMGKALRAHHYDQAIVLPNSFKSALIPWFARIPKRTGWVGEYRYGLLNDIRRLNEKRYPLMIEQYLALGLPPTESLPKPHPLPQLSAESASWQATLSKHHLIVSGRPVLALCPGAAYGPSKQWPADYFAHVANEMIQQGWEVWLLGSRDGGVVVEMIMRQTNGRCVNFAGRLSLSETIDLLSLTSGVVSNDSGLMHVACALSKPVVALYGSTSPAFTPPLSAAATVLQLSLDCQPCLKRECPLMHHRCMRDLTSDRVLSVIHAWGH